MANNIFYRLPARPGVRIAPISKANCNLDTFAEYLFGQEGLPRGSYQIICRRKYYRITPESSSSLVLNDNENIDVVFTLPGGKGGFGSLLRAIGAQIEKTTNRDACRDLSGRRLRDIKREDELKKLIALRKKLLEEKRLRKQEKLAKLKKRQEASQASASIQELVSMFDDQAYNKRRLEMDDIIEAAMRKGIINFKKRQSNESDPEGCSSNTKKSRLEPAGNDCSSKNEVTENNSDKIKSEETTKQPGNSQNFERKVKPSKKNLWLDLDEDELEDSGDEATQNKT